MVISPPLFTLQYLMLVELHADAYAFRIMHSGWKNTSLVKSCVDVKNIYIAISKVFVSQVTLVTCETETRDVNIGPCLAKNTHKTTPLMVASHGLVFTLRSNHRHLQQSTCRGEQT